MQVAISPVERRILRIWSDNIIHGGHWGDGDVVFPDEAIVLEKVSTDADVIELSARDLEIIRVWSDSSTDTPEETMLSKRIGELLASARSAGT